MEWNWGEKESNSLEFLRLVRNKGRNWNPKWKKNSISQGNVETFRYVKELILSWEGMWLITFIPLSINKNPIYSIHIVAVLSYRLRPEPDKSGFSLSRSNHSSAVSSFSPSLSVVLPALSQFRICDIYFFTLISRFRDFLGDFPFLISRPTLDLH